MPVPIRAVILVLVAALAACAAPPAPPPTPSAAPARARPTRTAAPTATAAPTPTPDEARASSERRAPDSQLTIWAVADEERRDALRSLILDAAHVAGADVAVSLTSADGLAADVRAAALAGLPLPDLVWGTQDDLGILQRAAAIQPADDGLDPAAFLPAAVEGATLDGQRWGTPLGAHGFLLLLHNRLLAPAPPATSDDLILRARQLTAGDRYGVVAGWAEPRWFAAWLDGVGGAVLGPDGAPALDTPQTVAALNLLKELRAAGPPPPSSYEQGARLFRDGRAAFAIDGDWSLARYRQYTDTLDLGAAPMPLVNATGRRAAAPLGGLYLMYGAGLDGARLAQAHQLGRTLALPEFQARVARDLGALPALRAALDTPVVTGDPVLAAAAATALDAPGIPPLDALRCAWDAIESALPPAILGDLTSEQAAARMQELAVACARPAP